MPDVVLESNATIRRLEGFAFAVVSLLLSSAVLLVSL
jgi:hypothetical protein